jgi:hypothetical protein
MDKLLALGLGLFGTVVVFWAIIVAGAFVVEFISMVIEYISDLIDQLFS